MQSADRFGVDPETESLAMIDNSQYIRTPVKRNASAPDKTGPRILFTRRFRGKMNNIIQVSRWIRLFQRQKTDRVCIYSHQQCGRALELTVSKNPDTITGALQTSRDPDRDCFVE
jgi:hypothetical protein